MYRLTGHHLHPSDSWASCTSLCIQALGAQQRWIYLSLPLGLWGSCTANKAACKKSHRNSLSKMKCFPELLVTELCYMIGTEVTHKVWPPSKCNLTQGPTARKCVGTGSHRPLNMNEHDPSIPSMAEILEKTQEMKETLVLSGAQSGYV